MRLQLSAAQETANNPRDVENLLSPQLQSFSGSRPRDDFRSERELVFSAAERMKRDTLFSQTEHSAVSHPGRVIWDVGPPRPRESIAARCAREVTQESQSVPLLLREASAGRHRWEGERRHLLTLWRPLSEEMGGLCRLVSEQLKAQRCHVTAQTSSIISD